jgi:Protein of unknown function (DUF3788)
MDIPNAFIGKATAPSAEELSAALGPTSALWHHLVDTMIKENAGLDQEWHSLQPKYGWNLILKLKKRRILYLGPCADCFRASLVLGDRAVSAARVSSLPKPVLKLLEEAPHYAEGTGLRLLVKTAKDLPAIRKLAQIKLAN